MQPTFDAVIVPTSFFLPSGVCDPRGTCSVGRSERYRCHQNPLQSVSAWTTGGSGAKVEETLVLSRRWTLHVACACRTGHYSPSMSYGGVVDICKHDQLNDIWYQSLHAIEPNQSDITDDATDWLSADPSSWTWESLASFWRIKREIIATTVWKTLGTRRLKSPPCHSCPCWPAVKTQSRRRSAGNDDTRAPRGNSSLRADPMN